jgi:O-antigen ligase
MTTRALHSALGAFFATAMAVALILALMMGKRTLFLAVPIGLAGALLVVRRPFLGLWLIVLLSQLDALANTLFRGLPISGVKILTGLTLVGVVIASYREPRSKRLGPDEPVLRLAVLFGTVLLISFLFVEDRALGLWSVRRLASLMVLLYLVVRLVTTREHVRSVMLAVLVSTLLSSCVVAADWVAGTHLVAHAASAVESQWQGIARSSGASDYNPTTAATLLLTGTACAMALFFRTSRWRLLTGATAVAGAAAIVLSYARSAGLVLGILILWLLFKYRSHRRLPVAIAGGLLALAIAFPLVPASYWQRQATLADFSGDVSLRRRLGYNIIGVHIVAEHPLLGVGPGNYKVRYMDPEYRWMPGRGVVPRQLHNMYLEVATETGLVGLACFGGMLLLALISLDRVRKRGSSREDRDLGEAVHFAFVGLLLASLFVPNEYNKYVWIFTGLGIALERASAREKAAERDGATDREEAPAAAPAGA